MINVAGDAREFHHSFPFSEAVDRLGARKASANYFITSSELTRYGVFATATGKGEKLKDRIMNNVLAVVTPTPCPVVAAAFERQPYKNPRGGLLIGTPLSICTAVLAAHVGRSIGVRGVDCSTGFYWQDRHRDNCVTRPYLDIDIKTGAPFGVFMEDVWPAIQFVDAELRAMDPSGGDNDGPKIQLYYNNRQDKGETKHSFHVHWSKYAFHDNTLMSAIVEKANNTFKAKSYTQDADGAFSGTETPEPMFDPRVYGSTKQLFRMPYSGKFGNRHAALRPIILTNETGDAGDFLSYARPDDAALEELRRISADGTFEEFVVAAAEFAERFMLSSMTVDTDERAYVLLQRPSNYGDALPAGLRAVRRAHSTSDGVQENQAASLRTRLLPFWMPVLKFFVLPNYSAFRQKQAYARGVKSANSPPTTARFWLENLDERHIFDIPGHPCSFRIEPPHGDCFCVHDSGRTPNTHTDGCHVNYTVDLVEGKITQNCQKCKPSTFTWHQFIQSGRTSFNVFSDRDQALIEGSDIVTIDKSDLSQKLNFFSAVHHDEVVNDRSQNNRLMVYNSETGIWHDGRSGNSLLLRLLRRMNENYKEYRRAVILASFKKMSTGKDEGQIQKLADDATAVINSIPALWEPTLEQQTKLHERLVSCSAAVHIVEEMEPLYHLVPLRGGRCINLYTWQESPSLPEYYFRSFVNASIVDLRDASVVAFEEWQNQVCCGDDEYTKYKFQLFGLSMTRFTFDRAFYFALGPLGRNGKSSEAKLMSSLLTLEQPSRGLSLTRAYLTDAGQKNQSASGTDTVTCASAYMTWGYVEEMSNKALATELIKQITSGDYISGRRLYKDETDTVKITYTLWMLGNQLPRWNNDPAFNNRARILPYNAIWSSNLAEDKARDPFNAHIYESDNGFADRLTSEEWRNAAATRSLYALHRFFVEQCDYDNNQLAPTKLPSFPVPRVVQESTQGHILKQQPVLAFKNKHLSGPHHGLDENECVTLDGAFQNFQRFVENNNYSYAKHYSKGDLESYLTQLFVECRLLSNDETTKYLVSYSLKSSVASQKTDYFGEYDYQPPAKKPRF